jgi:hypothetical protein
LFNRLYHVYRPEKRNTASNKTQTLKPDQAETRDSEISTSSPASPQISPDSTQRSQNLQPPPEKLILPSSAAGNDTSSPPSKHRSILHLTNETPTTKSQTRMASTAIIVPCAVLGSICAVMLVFVYWWFPRTWTKGNKGDTEAIALSFGAHNGDDGLTAEERRKLAGERAREYLAAIDARNKARAEGRELDEQPVYRPT